MGIGKAHYAPQTWAHKEGFTEAHGQTSVMSIYYVLVWLQYYEVPLVVRIIFGIISH